MGRLQNMHNVATAKTTIIAAVVICVILRETLKFMTRYLPIVTNPCRNQVVAANSRFVPRVVRGPLSPLGAAGRGFSEGHLHFSYRKQPPHMHAASP